MELKRARWEKIAEWYRDVGLENAALTIEKALKENPKRVNVRVSFRVDWENRTVLPPA